MSEPSPEVEAQDAAPAPVSRARKALLKRLADVVSLPASRVNAFERAMTADLLVEMLREAEVDERVRVASRLAPLNEIPNSLTRLLLRDRLEVAGVLIDDCGSLTDADLVACARDAGLDHRKAIAARRGVSEVVAETLVDRLEPQVLAALLNNSFSRLSQPAIEAVETGKTVFVHKQWENTFFAWMRDIQPWCISRQLWWGHRIPAWYGPDGEVFVANDGDEAAALARAKYGRDEALIQDEDVLDTWFSSALWPFSTMGWPEKTDDLRRFYPTSDLVTAADIIFFWVARMMMMGLHFMNEVPFKRVIINGLVRDEKGQKMSKSKGNVIDPLGIIDELGADPLRFTMAILSGTRDIKLSKQRIEGYRNFGTKLWNAARFSQMNGCARVEGFDPATVEQTINRWIRGELTKAERAVSEAIEGGRFDDAAGALYRFVWNVFCDWYLELAKPILNGEDEAAKAETRATTAWVLDQILILLHPVMPFITEELWDKLGHRAGQGMLIAQPWPVPAPTDAAADAEIGWLVKLISDIRSARAELNVPAGAKLRLLVVGGNAATAQRLRTHAAAIERLADGLASGIRHQTLLGATGTGKTYTIAQAIARHQRPTLVLAHNKTLAAQLYAEFREFFPDNAVEYFVSYFDYYQPEAYLPRSDTYIEKDSSRNDEIDRLRHAATHALFERRDVIVVASVSCIYGMGAPIDYGATVLRLRVGGQYRRDGVLRQLVDLQYQRNDQALARARFRVRGDTLELVPASEERLVRGEFFGGEGERITELDPLTGELLAERSEVTVYPATHYVTPADKLREAIVDIEAEMEERVGRLERSEEHTSELQSH